MDLGKQARFEGVEMLAKMKQSVAGIQDRKMRPVAKRLGQRTNLMRGNARFRVGDCTINDGV